MFFYNDLGTITTGQESVDMEVEDMLCQNSVDNEELMAQMDEIINLHIPSLLFRMTVLGKAHDFSTVKNILEKHENKIATVNSIIEGFDVVIQKARRLYTHTSVEFDTEMLICLKDYMKNNNTHIRNLNYLNSKIDYCIDILPDNIKGLNGFLEKCKKASADFLTENKNTNDISKCIESFGNIRRNVETVISTINRVINIFESEFLNGEYKLNQLLVDFLTRKSFDYILEKFDERFSLEKKHQQERIDGESHGRLTMSYDEHLKVDDIHIKLLKSLTSLKSELIIIPSNLLPDEAVRLTSQIEIAKNFSSLYELRSKIEGNDFSKINNILKGYDSQIAEVQKFIDNFNYLVTRAIRCYGFGSKISDEIQKKSKIIIPLKDHVAEKIRDFDKVKSKIAYYIEKLNNDFRALASKRNKNYICIKDILAGNDLDKLKVEFIEMASDLKNDIDEYIDDFNDRIIQEKDALNYIARGCMLNRLLTDIVQHIDKMIPRIRFSREDLVEAHTELTNYMTFHAFNDISNKSRLFLDTNSCCGEEKSCKTTSPPSTEPSNVVKGGEVKDTVLSSSFNNSQDDEVALSFSDR